MTNKPYTTCEWCGEKIDPQAPDTVMAVIQVPVATFGDPYGVADGLNALFHGDCPFPGLPRYRLIAG
jgi:hypothetical protein